MASNSGFSKFVPSGTSSIAQGDDDIRSFKSHMQAWWEDEHYALDGSASSAGEHKPGSARAFSLPASLLSGEVARIGQLSHDTTNNLLFVGSGSSISNVGGAGVNSVNTWTARQAFTGGVDIGGGSDIHTLTEVKLALAQTVLGPSDATAIDYQAADIKEPLALSALQLTRGEQVLQSLSWNSLDDRLVLTLFNPSASTVTISAQSVHISHMSFV